MNSPARQSRGAQVSETAGTAVSGSDSNRSASRQRPRRPLRGSVCQPAAPGGAIEPEGLDTPRRVEAPYLCPAEGITPQSGGAAQPVEARPVSSPAAHSGTTAHTPDGPCHNPESQRGSTEARKPCVP